jgi:hypothetical protein
VPDATRLGCRVRASTCMFTGVPTPTAPRPVAPVPGGPGGLGLVVQAHDQYMLERGACPQARRCDFPLANLFRERSGRRCRRRSTTAGRPSRRAGLACDHPHQLGTDGHQHRRGGRTLGGRRARLRPRGDHLQPGKYLHPHPTGCGIFVYRVELPRAVPGEVPRRPRLRSAYFAGRGCTWPGPRTGEAGPALLRRDC